jgi:hypothetical protein
MQQDGFHRRYLELVDEIERSFPVNEWRCGDVDLWPLARMDLYLDMMSAALPGAWSAPDDRGWLKVLTVLTVPLANLWKSRKDLKHWVAIPRAAHVVILGDGVSLDWDGQGWLDRFSEPLIAALEDRGLATFSMQGGALRRLPWARPTFAANQIAILGAIAARFTKERAKLPGRARVVSFLESRGVAASSLEWGALELRGRLVSSVASMFERVLRVSKPRMAFVTAWYAGLGPAFVLACRRQGVLSVDLQHAPQDGSHKAYGWANLPAEGYSTLPAVFWTWTEADAARIGRWINSTPKRWHQSLHGGHTQLDPFLHDDSETMLGWRAAIDAMVCGPADREILVALQPLAGQGAIWSDLAAQIQASPPEWRWWLRRHPAATAVQDEIFGPLLSLRQPNVLIDEASRIPLPALLRRVSAIVSLASGAASEAATFGVPALFLSAEAHGMFPDLIARGCAQVIDASNVSARIRTLSPIASRPPSAVAPPIAETLARLEILALDYERLCRPG